MVTCKRPACVHAMLHKEVPLHFISLSDMCRGNCCSSPVNDNINQNQYQLSEEDISHQSVMFLLFVRLSQLLPIQYEQLASKFAYVIILPSVICQGDWNHVSHIKMYHLDSVTFPH